MAPSFASLKSEYAHLWATMVLRADQLPALDAVSRKIIAYKTRYAAVEARTNVPWYVVGLIHAMEGGLDFSTHLHNGDPLTARTRQEPKGRPETGSPPFLWADSAVDAMAYDGLDDVIDWSIERIAYELEKYNGWGYRLYHSSVLTPYLWSYSTHYTAGKYAEDGHWSAGLVSGQAGAMCLLKRLMMLDASINPRSAAGADPGTILSPEQIQAMQVQLIALGYDLGRTGADGLYGPRTTAAVEAVQARAGLVVTGTADEATRKAIAAQADGAAPATPATSAPVTLPDVPEAPEPAPPTEEVVMSVQRRLRELGYTEVGEVDGLFGDRTRGGILAFRAAYDLPLIPRIDSELLVTLAGAQPRAVATTRAAASVAEVAAKVPGVAAARVAQAGAAAQTAIVGAATVLVGVSDYITPALDRLGPLKALIGTVPSYVWLGAVAATSLLLWRQASKATKAGTQDYRDARTM